MAAGLQHLQLYTYESLVSNIQRTINVTVTQRDLAQPTGHIVELLYLKFIHVIYALDIEDYLLDLYNQSEPQFADGFVLRIVQRYLRNIMRLTSGTSWIEGKTPVPFDIVRISDITEPNPARTKVILSSLINLVNLRDGESELYNDVVQQLIRLTEQREDSVQKIADLTKLIEDRKAVVEQRRGELEEQERKKEETERELAETNHARKRAKQELKEVKNEVIAKREKMEAVKSQVMEYETKRLDLQRKLVKSPERVQSEISNKAEEVLEKREQVQSREEMTRSLQSKLDRLRQIEKDCQAVKTHLETLQSVLHDRGEQQALVQSLTDDLEKHRIAYKEELAGKETWEKKGQSAQERVHNFNLRMENEQQELAARKAEVTLEYERATKERTEADTRIDAESKVATALEKEIAVMIAESELAIKEALGDYWRLMKQADEYISVIAKRLQLPLSPA